MQFRITVRLVLLVCCVGRTVCSAQQASPRVPDYDGFDSRTWSAPPAEAYVARDTLGPTAAPPAGTGANLYNLDSPLTGAQSGDPESAARSFLSRRIDSFVESQAGAIDLPLVSQYESVAAGLTHLVFRPEFEGIPYFDSGIQIHVDGDGRIWRVNQSHNATRPLELTTAASAKASIVSTLALLAPKPGQCCERSRPNTVPRGKLRFRKTRWQSRSGRVWCGSRHGKGLCWPGSCICTLAGNALTWSSLTPTGERFCSAEI